MPLRTTDLSTYNEHSQYIDQMNAAAMIVILFVGICILSMRRAKQS